MEAGGKERDACHKARGTTNNPRFPNEEEEREKEKADDFNLDTTDRGEKVGVRSSEETQKMANAEAKERKRNRRNSKAKKEMERDGKKSFFPMEEKTMTKKIKREPKVAASI